MNIAFITARKNSKGLPGKNMLELGGTPLIEHTFKAVIDANCFDKIYLSTDIPEAIFIAKKKYKKITVPFKRPKSLSSDKSTQIEVVNHLISHIQKDNFNFKNFVLFQPTSPFRSISEIKKGVNLLNSGFESVIGVSPVMHHPADYVFLENNKLKFLMPKYTSMARQNFPDVFFNNGSFYGCSLNFFKKKQKFYNSNSKLLIMSNKSLIDIDNSFDFLLAKSFFK